MHATSLTDLDAPVRYTLAHRPLSGDRVEVVLDLYRGDAPVLTKVVARVEREQSVLVMVKCRRYLDLRGVPPMEAGAAPAPVKAAARTIPASPMRTRAVDGRSAARPPAATRASAPVEAFDFMFKAG